MDHSDVTGDAERGQLLSIEPPISLDFGAIFLVEVVVAMTDAVAALIHADAVAILASEFVVIALLANGLLGFIWGNKEHKHIVHVSINHAVNTTGI